MQFDPVIPIWLQVMSAIETEVVTGQRPPGSKLPGGRETALKYSINPNTAARVYQELEKTGLCETRRGLGTFVTTDGAQIALARERLAREAAGRYLRRAKELGLSAREAADMLMKEEEDHA